MYNNNREKRDSGNRGGFNRREGQSRPVKKNSSVDFLEKPSREVARGISRDTDNYNRAPARESRDNVHGSFNRVPRPDNNRREGSYNRFEKPADRVSSTPRYGDNYRSENSRNDNFRPRDDRAPRSFSSNRGPSSRSYSSRGPNRGSTSQGFQGGRGRSGRRGPKGDNIDPARFIKKASAVTQVEYKPKHKFADFKVSDSLKRNIAARKYEIPTPIQDQTIPHIIEGKDIVGIANTGTGKTAAFLIPLIDKVIKNKKEKILIMTPTRELANQIQEEFREFSKGLGMYSVTVIGGESINKQIYALKKHTNFVIGTPGRIKDLINRGDLRLHDVGNVVLDEVDRMVDMGFIDDMTEILAELPKERHSLFFSATISKSIEVQILSFAKNPVTVSVKTQPTSDNVDQDIVRIERGANKVEILHDILIQEESKKVLIFVRTKRDADKLDRELYERGFKSVSLHGDKSQFQRQKSLDKFRESRADILVATDVAARGLDIPNVSHVINYDLPATYEDYVHRIGRTGRAHNKGKALTFVQ